MPNRVLYDPAAYYHTRNHAGSHGYSSTSVDSRPNRGTNTYAYFTTRACTNPDTRAYAYAYPYPSTDFDSSAYTNFSTNTYCRTAGDP